MANRKKPKKKYYITIPQILCIAGWIIIVASIIFAYVNYLREINEKLVAADIIALGVGCALTLPQHIEDFEEADGSKIVEGKGLILSITGILLIFVGIWLLFKN